MAMMFYSSEHHGTSNDDDSVDVAKQDCNDSLAGWMDGWMDEKQYIEAGELTFRKAPRLMTGRMVCLSPPLLAR